ncbi:MAG: GH3 auxin-responsive promoter family protein [Candidatus Omnitrophota bacterium]
MNIANLAIKTLAFKAKAFEKAVKDPIRYQKKILFDIIRRNEGAEYGRDHGFFWIKTISEYQSHVPVNNCESLCSEIQRMAKGKDNFCHI